MTDGTRLYEVIKSEDVKSGTSIHQKLVVEDCATLVRNDITVGQATRDYTLVRAAPGDEVPDFPVDVDPGHQTTGGTEVVPG